MKNFIKIINVLILNFANSQNDFISSLYNQFVQFFENLEWNYISIFATNICFLIDILTIIIFLFDVMFRFGRYKNYYLLYFCEKYLINF